MACTASALTSDSRCLVQGMSERQLLASIAYQLAVAAGVEPSPSVLIGQARCLAAGLGDHQLMAVIANLQCLINGG